MLYLFLQQKESLQKIMPVCNILVLLILLEYDCYKIYCVFYRPDVLKTNNKYCNEYSTLFGNLYKFVPLRIL